MDDIQSVSSIAQKSCIDEDVNAHSIHNPGNMLHNPYTFTNRWYFFMESSHSQPKPPQLSVSTYPRVLFSSSCSLPCISPSPKSAWIENCKHFTLHVPLQVLDEGPVYSMNIALIHSLDLLFLKNAEYLGKNRKNSRIQHRKIWVINKLAMKI